MKLFEKKKDVGLRPQLPINHFLIRPIYMWAKLGRVQIRLVGRKKRSVAAGIRAQVSTVTTWNSHH